MSWLLTRRESAYDLALFVLRLMLAVVFVYHGSQKLFGAFDGPGMSGWTGSLAEMGVPVPALAAWASALTEFFGGILLGFGVLTRLVAVPMITNMLIAIVLVHAGAFGASKGGMEFPLTLAVVLFALLAAGPGRFSVDQALDRRVRHA